MYYPLRIRAVIVKAAGLSYEPGLFPFKISGEDGRTTQVYVGDLFRERLRAWTFVKEGKTYTAIALDFDRVGAKGVSIVMY